MKRVWIAIGAVIAFAALAASGCARHSGNTTVTSLTSNFGASASQSFEPSGGANAGDSSSGSSGGGAGGGIESARFTLATHAKSDVDTSMLDLCVTPFGDGGIEITVVWNPERAGDDAAGSLAGDAANGAWRADGAAAEFIGFEIGYDADALHPVETDISDAISGVNSVSLTSTAVPSIVAFGAAALNGGDLNALLDDACAGGEADSGGGVELMRATFAPGEATAHARVGSDIGGEIGFVSDLAVEDLTVQTLPGGAQSLYWTEKNTGDYDMSGTVDVADIMEIAHNFGRILTLGAADYEILRIVDGDGNAEIGVSDITPIASNYLSSILGYDIYRTDYLYYDRTKLPNLSDGAPDAPTVIRPVDGETGWREGLPPKYTYADNPPKSPSSALRDTSATVDYLYQLAPRQSPPQPSPYPEDAMAKVNLGAVIDPPSGKARLTVTFTIDAQGQVPPFVYTYSFGDGKSLVDTRNYVVKHTYEDPGIYYPSVAVRDYIGRLTTSIIGKIVVEPPGDIYDYRPENLRAEGDGMRIWLKWDAVTHSELEGYNVYISREPNDPMPTKFNGNLFIPESNACLNSGIDQGAVYYARVSAVDTGGRESMKSAEIVAGTGTFDAPPEPPSNVRVDFDGSAVVLTWKDDINADVDHYSVYRALDGERASAVLLGSIFEDVREYRDSFIQAGTEYEYWISTVDNDGNASLEIFSTYRMPSAPKIVSISPLTGTDGESATFSAEVESEYQVTYEWYFSMYATPSSSTSPTPLVTFTMPGSITVRLTVTSILGSDEYVAEVDVAGVPPEILSVSPTVAMHDQWVTLNAVVVGSSPITEYMWSGILGSSVYGNNAYIQITTVGLRDATLRVTNPYGSDTFNFTFEVLTQPPTKYSTDGVTPTRLAKGMPTQIRALASGMAPMYYVWTFGDGVTPSMSTDAEPAILMSEYGSATGSVTISNAYGEVSYVFTLYSMMPGWEIETIDAGYYNYVPSLRLDSSDQPHVIYAVMQKLRHLFRTSEGWEWEELVDDDIDSSDPPVFSIGLDGSLYTVYTAYFGGQWRGYYMSNVTSQWLRRTLLIGKGRKSIAVDKKGNAHIGYCPSSPAELQYISIASPPSGQMETQVVEQIGTYSANSLAVGSDDLPRIAYATNGQLKYAEYTGEEWNIYTIIDDGISRSDVSLVLDSSDLPHIFCRGLASPTSTPSAIYYAYFDGTTWTAIIVESSSGPLSGFEVDAAIDSNDLPRIVCRDSAGQVIYAWTDGLQWNCAPVDLLPVGVNYRACSLAIDSYDISHLIYISTDLRMLKYARLTG